MTESGYSRSKWGKLSIQDRIRAMNDTLDNVEHAVSPIDLRKIEKNSSLDNGALAIPATAPLQKRSSVVDIWRQREGKSASPTTSKGEAGNKLNGEESLQSVKTALAKRFQSMPASENLSRSSFRYEEKKEEENATISSKHEESQSARDLWNRKVSTASVSVLPFKASTEPSQKSGVPQMRKWSNQKSDQTISLTGDIDDDGKSQSSNVKKLSLQNEQANQRASSVFSVHDDQKDSVVSPTSQRSSVLQKWKRRSSGGDFNDDVPMDVGPRPVVVPPSSVEKKIFSTTLSQSKLDSDVYGTDASLTTGNRDPLEDSSGTKNHDSPSDSHPSNTLRSTGDWAKRMTEHLQQGKGHGGPIRPRIHELEVPLDKPEPPRRNHVLQRWNSRIHVQEDLSNEGTNSVTESIGDKSTAPSTTTSLKFSTRSTTKLSIRSSFTDDNQDAQEAERNETGSHRKELKPISTPPGACPKPNGFALPQPLSMGNIEERGNGLNMASTKRSIEHTPGVINDDQKYEGAPAKDVRSLEPSKSVRNAGNAEIVDGSAIDPWSRWGTKPRKVKSGDISLTTTKIDKATVQPQEMPDERTAVNPLKTINIFNVLPPHILSVDTDKSILVPESQKAQDNNASNESGCETPLAASQPTNTEEDSAHSSLQLSEFDQSVDQVEVKSDKPFVLPKPAKLLRSLALSADAIERPQLSRTVSLSSQSSAFDAWDGKLVKSDLDSGNHAKHENATSRKKKDLVNMGRKHAVNGLGHKIAVAQSASMVSMSSRDEDSFRLEEALSLRSVGRQPYAPLSHFKSESSRDNSKNETQSNNKSFQKALTDSVSDSKPRGNAQDANPQRKTMPLALRIERDPFAVQTATRESDKASNLRTKRPVATSKLPTPKFSDVRKGSLGHTPLVHASFGRDQLGRDDDNSVESATPKSKKLTTERLVAQKRKLQAQRRKLKSHSMDGDEGDSISPPTPTNKSQKSEESAQEATRVLQSGLSKIEENGSGSMSGLHGLALVPISDTLGSSMGHDATAGLQGTPATAMSHKYKFPLKSPRSETGVSDGGFSFFSDAHSAVSSTMSATSSLANRAEKLLQERRRKQLTQHTVEDEDKAMFPARDMLYSAAAQIVNEQQPTFQERSILKQGSILKNSRLKSAAECVDASQPPGDRAGLSSRYNTSSRFIDNETSESLSNPVTSDGASLEHSMSTDSVASSYHSTGTATTESDSRSEKKNRARRSRKAKLSRSTTSEGQPMITDNFVSESASNAEAFSSACNAMTLRQIAADLAGEVSTGIAALHIDKLARDGVQAIRDLVGTKGSPSKMKIPKCDEMVPFDEEDIAIEVEYMEDSVDGEDTCAEQEMGVCTAVDDAIARGSSALNCSEDVKASGQSSVPAGQPSFEEPSGGGKKAAYV